MKKEYVVIGLLMSSLHYLNAAHDEMEDPLLVNGESSGKDNEDLYKQQEKLRLKEQEAQRVRGRSGSGKGSQGPLPKLSLTGSLPSGQRDSSGGDQPVSYDAAENLASVQKDYGVRISLDAPVERSQLSSKDKKRAKSDQNKIVKSFDKMEASIRKAKNTSQVIDTFLNEISRCNFVNGRLPEELRILIVGKLKILQKNRSVDFYTKKYTGIIIDALEKGANSDRAILEGGAKQLQEVSDLLREIGLPIRYDRSQSLSEQSSYKKAEELERKLENIMGIKYKSFTNQVIIKLVGEYWRARGIILTNESFDPKDRTAILSRIATDTTILQDPLVVDFVQEHVSELFSIPTTAKVYYQDNFAGEYTRDVSMDGKTWKKLLDDMPEGEDAGVYVGDVVKGTKIGSDAEERYSDLLVSKFILTAVSRLRNSSTGTFKQELVKLVKIQLDLVLRLKNFLIQSDGMTVDSFIIENRELFDELKNLSPEDYEPAMKTFRALLA